MKDTVVLGFLVDQEPDKLPDLYDQDFYGWCLEQAALVRAGRLDALDLGNIAEELESLGKEQAHRLEAAYRILLLHLLKWRHQPGRRSRSWRSSVARERINAERCLRQNPGLKPRQAQLVVDAYADARRLAAVETGLPLTTFPAACPFTLEQALDDGFWPGSV